jgi:hypothetical protein
MAMTFQRLTEIHRGEHQFLKTVTRVSYLSPIKLPDSRARAAFMMVTHNGFSQETIFSPADLRGAIKILKESNSPVAEDIADILIRTKILLRKGGDPEVSVELD